MNAKDDQGAIRRWKIELVVSVGTLVTLVGAMWAAAWWSATMESRVIALENWTSQNNKVLERLGSVEVRVETVRAQTSRIEDKIDKLVDKR